MHQSFLIGLALSLSFFSFSYSQNDTKQDNKSLKTGNDQIEATQDNEQLSSVYKEEIKIEIEKLKKLRKEVEKKIEEDKKILEKIKEERKKLQKEREEFEKYIKQVEAERYKKLAKIFEKMDPELAGEKISKMKDPKTAAFIIYNMKDRKAGEVMNYVDPAMVNKITRIITDIKRSKKMENKQ